jgi:predicted alpha/beta-hydrolase family hydrolase
VIELAHDGELRARGVRIVLAPGAGADMHSPFMRKFARELAARGHAVTRFDFPYMQRRRVEGRRTAIDRAPLLLSTYRDVVELLGAPERVIIGGKSMGGRMASMLADELGVAGLVCLGYPFHPVGQPEKLRTAHLAELRTRTLIVQGTRDPFGTREEVAGYRLSSAIELCWLEDGDHSFAPRRGSGHRRAEHEATALDAIGAFARAIERSV